MSKVAGKRVFLSGPMTGVSHNNAHRFVDAHLALLDAGAAHVYDPAVMWLATDEAEAAAHTHEDWMRTCIHELTDDDPWSRYDILVRLPGWEESAGAAYETSVALACGMECADLGEVLS